VSESIRVVSIVGRFLEHDRVFYFENAGDAHLYIGSADWQRSRLDDRVEAAVPIRDAHHQDRILRSLQAALDDPRTAWDLYPDGRYVQRTPTDDTAIGVQERHIQEARERAGMAPDGSSFRRR
jgi:polyphosphate kinase